MNQGAKNLAFGPTGASPPPLGGEQGSYGARATGQRGSYTEADRSGQPYIPGAHEAQKPPYAVTSPRSTRRQVFEGRKTDEEVNAEIFREGVYTPKRSASEVSSPRPSQEPSVIDKLKNSLGLWT
jgi:hypothetical protein